MRFPQSLISVSLIRWFQIATPFQLHGKCNLAYEYRCLCSVVLAEGKKNSYCSSFCIKPLFLLFRPPLCPWLELRWHVFTVVQPGLSLRGQKDIPPATPSPCTRQLHYASWPRWFPTPPWFPHPPTPSRHFTFHTILSQDIIQQSRRPILDAYWWRKLSIGAKLEKSPSAINHCTSCHLVHPAMIKGDKYLVWDTVHSLCCLAFRSH